MIVVRRILWLQSFEKVGRVGITKAVDIIKERRKEGILSKAQCLIGDVCSGSSSLIQAGNSNQFTTFYLTKHFPTLGAQKFPIVIYDWSSDGFYGPRIMKCLVGVYVGKAVIG